MKIAIINYPGALQSAVFGLSEMFSLANQLITDENLSQHFDVDILDLKQIEQPIR